MFSKASKSVREGTYGVVGTSVISQSGSQQTINVTMGSAFMVAPKYLLTAAHVIHQENNLQKPVQQTFELIRAPEIGGEMKKATFICEDRDLDLALLKVEGNNNHSLVLKKDVLERGTSCGFLGFPLAEVKFLENGSKNVNITERFQGAHISNVINLNTDGGKIVPHYEIDALMYPGSSGCPGFDIQGDVIGLQVKSMMSKTESEDRNERVAISYVVPSTEILKFLASNKIKPVK